MSGGSKIFVPCRGLGYVSNHIPLQVRYIKNRKENLIVTCVGKSFHTYGITHFGLLSVSGLHPDDISCMVADTFHVYTACKNTIYAWRRGVELKYIYTGHKKDVRLLLPFGPHLISIDEVNLKVWDIKAATVYLELTFNKAVFETTTILHPNTCINKILLGSNQGEMQLWNINTAKLIYTFKGWKCGISCLENAPAEDVVAIGLVSGRIILHNLKYDEMIMDFIQDWGRITSISFRTDGEPIMATGSTIGHIVFWNLEERRVTNQLLSAHDDSVTGMACLPNEPLMLTSSPDNTLKLWIFDMADGGARLLRIREGHSAPPTFIRFHGGNGHNILSAASDSTLRIFNTRTEQFNKSLGKASYNKKASKKHRKTIAKMRPIVQFTSEITREKEWDNIAAIHSGIPLVTTWSYDRMKMGDLKLLPERFKQRKDDNVSASSIHLTHCGNFVLIGYTTGHIDKFNIQSGIWRGSYGDPKAHDSCIRGVASDTLNQITVSGGSDGIIKFWQFKPKTNSPLIVLNLDEPISFFRCHPESSMLAVACENFDIYIVDMESRRIVRKFVGHSAQITDITFSPDSRWLISSSMDCSIKTWDIPSCQLIDQFATEFACVSLTMSPTGELLATAHVNYLGIFLWTNRTLYSKVTLKALSPSEQPTLVALPECSIDINDEDSTNIDSIKEEIDGFKSPEQISKELVTLSGISSSRWQNLLNIDIIKRKNKPKEPLKIPKSAPFFLPTVSSLDFRFDLNTDNNQEKSRFLTPSTLINLSEFGKLLETSRNNDGDDQFELIIEKLKTFGPSMVDFEIKSLSPDGGGTLQIMLEFLKCIEFMLKSNRDFELAESYLSVFLRSHGDLIAKEPILRTYLPNIQSCHNVVWNRLQEKFLYGLCVVQNLKTM